uniref:Uncharacterized protein n=1 Tax=Falco tinnunculus TaxID=100819 RepID=A0A8C4UR79_FALTI
MAQGWGCHGDGDTKGVGTSKGLGTLWRWGRHRVGDVTGMGTQWEGGIWGWGHHRVGDTVGKGDMGLTGLGTLWGGGTWGQSHVRGGDTGIPGLGHCVDGNPRGDRDGLWRFESAANPGWFLCTSARGHQPLGLSRHPDATHLLDFYFQLG